MHISCILKKKKKKKKRLNIQIVTQTDRESEGEREGETITSANFNWLWRTNSVRFIDITSMWRDYYAGSTVDRFITWQLPYRVYRVVQSSSELLLLLSLPCLCASQAASAPVITRHYVQFVIAAGKKTNDRQ